MTADRVSAFTSDKARAKFLSRYDTALDRLWPVERETADVGTTFGTARVYRSGPSGSVPVVLLPGAGGGALMWYRYVARLAEARPVFALDPVGEPGGGRQDAPIVDGRDVARCLNDVLGALDIDHAHLVGCSYGGWTALQHEIHHPGRAATITLLDPAGFARLSAKTMMWIIAGGLAGLGPAPLRRQAARWLNNPTLRDDEIMRLVVASMSFRRRLPAPAMFRDDDLRAVTIPTLALLGERSQMHDAAQVAARIRTLVPAARVDVVPGAGHALPIGPPHLPDRIAAFLDTADTRT